MNAEFDKEIKEALKEKTILEDIQNNDYKLYNYTKINKNTIRNTLDEEFWLGHPNTFNNPIDPPIKILEDDKHKYIIEHIRIGCLYLKNNNSLMWSHYADKHEGMCIEYDLKDFLESNIGNISIIKVNYTEEIINEQGNIKIHRNRLSLPDENKSDSYNLSISNELIDILSTKSKEWEYEKEYRIIKYFNNDSNVLNLPIKSICFGAKTPKEDKYLLRKILSNKNIEFYEANFNDRILNNVIINKLNQIKTNGRINKVILNRIITNKRIRKKFDRLISKKIRKYKN